MSCTTTQGSNCLKITFPRTIGQGYHSFTTIDMDRIPYASKDAAMKAAQIRALKENGLFIASLKDGPVARGSLVAKDSLTPRSRSEFFPEGEEQPDSQFVGVVTVFRSSWVLSALQVFEGRTSVEIKKDMAQEATRLVAEERCRLIFDFNVTASRKRSVSCPLLFAKIGVRV